MAIELPVAEYVDRFGEPRGYCDFARFGPVSRDVASTVSAAFAELVEGVDIDHLESDALDVRRLAAELTGRDGPDQVVFTSSTSAGLFQLAFSLPTSPAAELLVSAEEFPANVHPWLRAAERGGPTVRFLPGHGPVTPERVAAALRPATMGLAVSAVDYRTGYRCDLAALRSLLGDRLLLVDGIQAFGACHLEWGLADAVVVGGQKWLRAGWGTGFVSLSARALDRLGAGLTGWRGMVEPMCLTTSPVDMRPEQNASRFAMTSPDLVAAASLGAALRLLVAVTPHAMDTAIGERTARLVEAIEVAKGSLLLPLESGERSGIVSFSIPGHTFDEVGQALAARGLVVSIRADHVRVSPHATTSLEVIAEFADVLGKLTRGGTYLNA